MKLHYTGRQADWETVPAAARNGWQRAAAASGGVLTPGNAVSVLGIALVVAGLAVIAAGQFWPGLGLLAAGRAADILDGAVAERTATKGPVGEAVDAVMDKAAAIAVLVFFVHSHRVPLLPVACIALQVILNSLLAFTAHIRYMELHPSAPGKISAVAAWLVLLVFPVATELGRTGPPGAHGILLVLGYAATVVFAVMALLAATGYFRSATAGLSRPAPGSAQDAEPLRGWLELVPGVAAIDFAAWHRQHGVRAVLFDVEGTLTPWADPQVDDEVAAALRRARQVGIVHVGLVSNMHPRHSARAAAVASQIDAATYHVPVVWRERKPSPAMIRAALAKLDVPAHQAGFAGDKLVDVLAARRAGIAKVAWVDRLGTVDHPLDRVLYRPVERVIKWALKQPG